MYNICIPSMRNFSSSLIIISVNGCNQITLPAPFLKTGESGSKSDKSQSNTKVRKSVIKALFTFMCGKCL